MIRAGTYPEMSVAFYGKDWTTFPGFTARIEQWHTVFVDDFTNADGTTDRRGDFHPTPAAVCVGEQTLTADEATALSTAIEDAATELHRY